MPADNREPRTSTLWDTQDISIAAYLRSVGVHLLKLEPYMGSGGQSFVFNDTHAQCEALAIQFVGSPEGLFDLAQRAIKKLVFPRTKKGLSGSRGDWKTPDYQIAAWLVLQPCAEFVGFRRTSSRRREYEFFFKGDPLEIRRSVREYGSSNVSRYAQAQKELHDMTRRPAASSFRSG